MKFTFHEQVVKIHTISPSPFLISFPDFFFLWLESKLATVQLVLRLKTSLKMSDERSWILPKELLENSPSRADGISLEQEKSYRFKTTWFMEEFGHSMGKYD